MDGIEQDYEDVKILPPDYSLKRKIGNVNLDQILSPNVVQAAQEIISQSSGQFENEAFSEIETLGKAVAALRADFAQARALLPDIIASSFSLKAKAGLGGYDLVSVIAKSLYLYCEQLDPAQVGEGTLTIILWHAQSMKKLLDQKIQGDGGPIGTAILAELEKIKKA